jgi:hypothetical protein
VVFAGDAAVRRRVEAADADCQLAEKKRRVWAVTLTRPTGGCGCDRLSRAWSAQFAVYFCFLFLFSFISFFLFLSYFVFLSFLFVFLFAKI